MAIAAHAGGASVARRPAPTLRRSTEPDAVLAALMLVMVLIGFAAVVLAAQADHPPTAPRERPVEGWVGGPPAVRAVESSEPSTPVSTIVPTVQPLAPPAEPVRAEPALTVDGRARVVNTAGRGVVLHAEPRRGARMPAGLLEGASVTLLELAGEEWARVRSPQGRVGWVPTAYLAPAD